MERILLLLGTNIGDLKANLLNALKEFKRNEITVLKRSKIYKTKPWGNVDQPDFLNMAVEVKCDYKPAELLDVLKKIESALGREKTGLRWGPRVIDIDILFYGSRTVMDKDLVIPHREFYNRPFAIKTLSEIAPDYIPPHSDRKIKDYLDGVDDEGFEIYRG